MSDLGAVSPSRVVVAGDWHGNTPWALHVISAAARLLAGEGQPLLLHLGDYGILPGPAGQRYARETRKACQDSGVTLGFIDGNHEDFTQLHRPPGARPAYGTCRGGSCTGTCTGLTGESAISGTARWESPGWTATAARRITPSWTCAR